MPMMFSLLFQIPPQHITEIRTLDPADTDFADLQHLQAAIGGARVVMLGEQTHGDGAAFLLKTRLVKFLHQEMGFDVLVFESGLYDCDRDPHTGRCLLFVWESSRQMQPLIRYIDETGLELAGMDIQLTEAAADYLPHDLTTAAQHQGSDLLTTERGQLFLRVLRDLATSVESNPPDDAQTVFFAVLAEVRAVLQRSEDGAYWVRVLDGAAAYAEQIWRFEVVPDGYTRRDVLMGENLLWLANERHAGRKLIVWTGGYHAVRNLPSARTPTGETLVYPSHITAADVAYATLGNDMRVFNITAGAGTYYNWQHGDVFPVPRPQLSTFEAQMNTLAFVDLRGITTPMTGTPVWNYEPVTAEWRQLFDGMFFVPQMTPSERVR